MNRGRVSLVLARLLSFLHVYGHHYDWIAHGFVRRLLIDGSDPEEEQVAVFTDVTLLHVPNRHEDPRNHCRVSRRDVPERMVGDLVGYLHSHPTDGCAGPSDDDYDALPGGQVGGVWRRGSRFVDFYDQHGIVRSVRLPHLIT